MIGCHLWNRRSQQFKPETGGEPHSGVGLQLVPRATAVGRHFGVVRVFALDEFMVCRPCFRMIFAEFAYLSERLSVISYTLP